MNQTYKTKALILPGTNYAEVYPLAHTIYKDIVSKSKRRPYARSPYFGGNKVFLDHFWDHIRSKNPRDRCRRLKYYACAIDLIEHSRMMDTCRLNPNRSSEMLYRFIGSDRYGNLFIVQIKENLKNKEKDFMSVFPLKG